MGSTSARLGVGRLLTASWLAACAAGRAPPPAVDTPPQGARLREVRFGINNAYASSRENTSAYLLDLGAKWISDHAPRRQYELSEESGDYDFSELDAKLAEYVGKAGAQSWLILNTESKYAFSDGRAIRWGKSKGKFIPEGPQSYEALGRFLRALYARVSASARPAYYSVDNEHASLYLPAYCPTEDAIDTACGAAAAAGYADLVVYTGGVLAELDPTARVVFGGPGGGTPEEELDLYYGPALARLVEIGGAEAFAAFDYHNFGSADEYRTNSRGLGLAYYRDLLAAAGVPDKPILIKAGATHSGMDLLAENKRLHVEQDEAEQASYLVKRFAYHLGEGVELILWGDVREDEEQHGTYSHNGLVYNGLPAGRDCAPDEILPCPDPGDGISKLSYFSFKLLAEKLEGSDWAGATATEMSAANTYAYRFPKASGSAIYVVWWDAFAEQEPAPRSKHVTLALAEQGSLQVLVTDAVPTAPGKYRTAPAALPAGEYPSFFVTRTVGVEGGVVEIDLGPVPVLVEPLAR